MAELGFLTHLAQCSDNKGGSWRPRPGGNQKNCHLRAGGGRVGEVVKWKAIKSHSALHSRGRMRRQEGANEPYSLHASIPASIHSAV